MERDLLDGGANEEKISFDPAGQERGCIVFINDRGNTLQVTLLVGDNRDTAASDRNLDNAGGNQLFNDRLFHNSHGEGRWHDPAPTPAGIFHHVPAFFVSSPQGLGFIHK